MTGLVILAVGSFVQVASGYWDVYSHRVSFRIFDSWWNPAHLSLYSGFLVAVVGALLSLRGGKSSVNPVVRIGPILAGVGVAVETIAGTWNEVHHRLFASEPPIAPAHALLVVGMIMVNLGAILGLSILLGITRESSSNYSRPMKQTIVVSLVASYTAIWLLTSGSTMYVAGVYRETGGYFGGAIGLAWIAPMILIPAMRTVDRFGAAISIGLSYAFFNLIMLVAYLGEEAYVPFGVLSAIVFDLAYFGVKRLSTPRIAALIVGLLSGPMLLVTYYPFTPSVFTVQWTESLRFTLAMSTAAGLVGGITGYAAVDGTRSLLLRVTSRSGQ